MAATAIDEIADGIVRINTHLDAVGSRGLGFGQFVVRVDEPVLIHTGMRGLSGSVLEAIARVLGGKSLRWVSFLHVESDECGALDDILRGTPCAQPVFPERGCDAAVDAWADRPARRLGPAEVLDIGGRRLRSIPTPHVPHNWEAHVLYEEVTATLFCGDLLGQEGRAPATTEDLAVVERALDTRLGLLSGPPGQAVPETLDELADLDPHTLAVMHGASVTGRGADALRLLADGYRARDSREGSPVMPVAAMYIIDDDGARHGSIGLT